MATTYSALATILCIYLVCCSATATSNGGFSVKLIHRNSPNSPFYHRTKTPPNRLSNGFRHSMRPYFDPFDHNGAQSGVKADKGEYLMKLTIGNPPFDVYGVADTGSDLVWAQCLPCVGCYKQTEPMFEPKSSSTYSDLPCAATECRTIGTGSCSPQYSCNYSYGYGDQSLTQGVLAKETITLTSTTGGAVAQRDIVFGCGHNNTGSFNQDEMGLIGLGGGPLSLVSQISSKVGGKKFSHCLVPFHTAPSIESKMSFGSGSEVLGDGVVTTALISKQDKTPYFVTLEGISVEDKLVPFNTSGQVLEGNMFLDSGTPPTLIPQDFYNRLAAEVKSQIPMAPIVGDPSLGHQLCYKTPTNLKGPILTVHCKGSANIVLTPIQTFIPPKDGVFCFAMQGVASDGGTIGNFAQSNFLIGYDLERMTVSFKPADCTKG
ncbi:hypothetical protein ACLB2K_064770 [Fragaria x ananassa]